MKPSRLEQAAERVLSSLNDDNDDCLICGTRAGYWHESGSSCGELQEALMALKDKRKKKRKHEKA